MLSLQGNGLENEVNELFRLAPRMDNLQTVKRFLDHKFKVHLETSGDSGALKLGNYGKLFFTMVKKAQMRPKTANRLRDWGV